VLLAEDVADVDCRRGLQSALALLVIDARVNKRVNDRMDHGRLTLPLELSPSSSFDGFPLPFAAPLLPDAVDDDEAFLGDMLNNEQVEEAEQMGRPDSLMASTCPDWEVD